MFNNKLFVAIDSVNAKMNHRLHTENMVFSKLSNFHFFLKVINQIMIRLTSQTSLATFMRLIKKEIENWAEFIISMAKRVKW